MKSFLILSLCIFISCSDDSFKKVDKLGEFRVLGIQSSSPEVAPGDPVTINLLLSDKNGAGRQIDLEIERCLDPGIAFGAQPSCENDPSAQSTQVLDVTNSLAAPNYTGIIPNVINFTVPAAIHIGRNDRDKFNGVGYLVIFTFDVDGKKIKTFKRIMATTRTNNNLNSSNPTFIASDLLLNGAPINNQMPVEGNKLSLTSGAPDIYQYQNVDGSIDLKTEKFEVAWYTDEGEFSKPKSYVEELVEFKNASSNDPSVLVVVIRDGRGGLSYLIEEFP